MKTEKNPQNQVLEEQSLAPNLLTVQNPQKQVRTGTNKAWHT